MPQFVGFQTRFVMKNQLFKTATVVVRLHKPEVVVSLYELFELLHVLTIVKTAQSYHFIYNTIPRFCLLV